VALATPAAAIVSRPILRTNCDRCGEEIINEREVITGGQTLCRSCAGPGYYRPLAENQTPSFALPESREVVYG